MKNKEMERFEEAFRKIIKKKRIKLRKTQYDFAADLDMGQKYFSKLERGKIGLPKAFTLFKMFQKEHISIDDLFREVIEELQAEENNHQD